MAVLLTVQGGVYLLNEVHGLLPALGCPVPGEIQGGLDVIVNVMTDQTDLVKVGGGLLVMGELLGLAGFKGLQLRLTGGQAKAVFVQL